MNTAPIDNALATEAAEALLKKVAFYASREAININNLLTLAQTYATVMGATEDGDPPTSLFA